VKTADVGSVPLPFFLTDHARSLMTFGCLAAALPILARAPRGDGRPVIVLPGLGAGDLSTRPLRSYLQSIGHEASGWGLGINLGPTRKVLNGITPIVEELAALHDSPVALVGWSLGGVFARAVARQVPEAVSQVITLGSPFRFEHPHQARSIKIYNRLSPFHAPEHELPESDIRLPVLPVPASSIYSRLDGIVDWRSCIDHVDSSHENIQVWASHLGYGHDPTVMWAVADRLAQPAGTWQPFVPPQIAELAFPSPHALSA